MIISMCLLLLFSFLLVIKNTILIEMFRNKFHNALITGNDRDAFMWGRLYYSCISKYERKINHIHDVEEKINHQITAWKSIRQFH